mgnify:CR=1 FL=1
MTYTLEQINEILQGEIIGNTNQVITAPEQLERASATEISFIGNKKYEKLWETSKACAAVVNQDISIEAVAGKVISFLMGGKGNAQETSGTPFVNNIGETNVDEGV